MIRHFQKFFTSKQFRGLSLPPPPISKVPHTPHVVYYIYWNFIVNIVCCGCKCIVCSPHVIQYFAFRHLIYSDGIFVELFTFLRLQFILTHVVPRLCKCLEYDVKTVVAIKTIQRISKYYFNLKILGATIKNKCIYLFQIYIYYYSLQLRVGDFY